MNYEIKRADWGTFFDNLSKRRYEWMTEVEVLSPDSGSQMLSNGLPFNGMTVEVTADHSSIDISVGETISHHQTHTIKDPSRVAFLAGDDTHSDVVDIEEADGTKTLIRFTEPMGVLVGMAEYEMVLAAT
jgi:hypothetical protein